MNVMAMKHDADPAEEAIKAIGDISGIELYYNQVMVVIYIRPEKTKGNIILTDNYRQEDEFQGKVGIVVKKGPLAFIPSSDDPLRFAEVNVDIGDYVVYRPSDGWPVKIDSVKCRILADTAIKMKIDRPDRTW